MSNKKETKKQTRPCQLELFTTTKILQVAAMRPAHSNQNACFNYAVSSNPTDGESVVINFSEFKSKQNILNFYEEINKLTSHIK